MLGKRILHYLNGTKNKYLYYDHACGILKAYSDASWGNAENKKSFSEGAVFIGNSLISWKGKKQRTVGNSTCEVELFAVSELLKISYEFKICSLRLRYIEYIANH